MSGSRAALASSAGGVDILEPLTDYGVLIKRDRPRSIDRYIDYFGGSASGRPLAATTTPARDAADPVRRRGR